MLLTFTIAGWCRIMGVLWLDYKVISDILKRCNTSVEYSPTDFCSEGSYIDVSRQMPLI